MSSREASDREAALRSQQPDNIVYALDDEDSVKAEEDEVDIITPVIALSSCVAPSYRVADVPVLHI